MSNVNNTVYFYILTQTKDKAILTPASFETMQKSLYRKEDFGVLSDRKLKSGEEVFVFDRFNYVNKKGYEDNSGAIVSRFLNLEDVKHDLYKYFCTRSSLHECVEEEFMKSIEKQVASVFDGSKFSTEIYYPNENTLLTTWCELYRASVA